MSEAVIIYPHQLYSSSPALTAITAGQESVYLVEEPLILTHNPIHRQKLIFHKLSLDAYERHLRDYGHTVVRLSIHDHPKTNDVFKRVQNDGIEKVHIVDTTDDFLEQAIEKSGLKRVWYDSPLFILPKANAITRYENSKRFMAAFYKQLRIDKDILMNGDEPVGGKWSFDEANRKKLPKKIDVPDDIELFGNAETGAAEAWAATIDAEQYGEPGCWLPYTHEGAQKFLQEFLCQRFSQFGPYEDAISTRGTRLFHSTLSPLLNVGLLTPQKVLGDALDYAGANEIPLNSLEGFVRQILGWREFIRASYECDGHTMRTKNFWQHERNLSASFWDGTTGIDPVDQAINTALQTGYTHHIERLMVLGNFMLLCNTHPDEVYRWFMGMYLDAYDWVMVPNVYGMSQFADGGNFATKPYVSGANYIKKMSDYPAGEWETTWTALYWNFINNHNDVFKKNHRLAMMPRMLEKMDSETRTKHLDTADTFLSGLGTSD